MDIIALFILVIAGVLMMAGAAWAMPELFEGEEE